MEAFFSLTHSLTQSLPVLCFALLLDGGGGAGGVGGGMVVDMYARTGGCEGEVK